MNSINQEDTLVKRADLARARLLAVVDLLDRKRELVTDSFKHPMQVVARRMPEPAVTIVLGVAAVAAVSALGYLIAKRRKERERFELFKQVPPPPSFWGEVARGAARTLITFALVQGGKKVLREQLQKPELA
jgi:hypothetical protein